MKNQKIRITTGHEVREYMVETALKIFAIVCLFAIVLATVRVTIVGFTLSWFVQIPMAISIIFSYIFRKKLSTKTKSNILSLGLLVILAGGMTSFGILASTKYLILLIPVISSMLLSFKKSVQLFSIVLSLYIVIGFLHIIGVLKLPQAAEVLVKSPSTWLLDMFILTASGLIILQIVHNFLEVLNLQFEKAISQNEEISKQEEEYRTLFEQTKDAVFLLV